MDQLSFDPKAAAIATGHLTVGDPVQWLRHADASNPFPSFVRGGTRLDILEVSGDFVLARAGSRAGWLPRERVTLDNQSTSNKPVIVRSYKGKNHEDAARLFQIDAVDLAQRGYYPTSQSWAQGSYGCGAFLLALILAVVLVGILIFIYMLLVKPDGTLTVTYEYRAPHLAESPETTGPVAASPPPSSRPTKRCPRCAEDVLVEAVICRFCGHTFEPNDMTN